MSDADTPTDFAAFALPAPLLEAVRGLGYETPTPIQARTIPPLLDGHDVLGHAPTGTGKTAAFALPILARIDSTQPGVQALILTPTRELAIQVAEALTAYAARQQNLRILPIYGGQEYAGQLRQLARGVNVVVGTPGRVMDHMRRGSLKLDRLRMLVLDEADEMLRMGFIDDVEWILDQAPATRQVALFSATMPPAIHRIATRHLREPVEVTIEGRTRTAATIRQRYWMVSGLHKLDALTRILEAERFDAMLVFVRTKLATSELAEKLEARGFAAAAMNGDMPQKLREQMVEKLRRGALDILVATDVVARGLDVERISHVVNYDIPYDTEAYVHRIGRTGRAGRSGDAILFVTPREKRLLHMIERATRQPVEPLALPTVEMVNNKRIADFKQRIADTLATGELAYLQRLVEEYAAEHDVPAERIAAALAKMAIGDQPLLLQARDEHPSRELSAKEQRREKRKEQRKEQRKEKHGELHGEQRTDARREKHDDPPIGSGANALDKPGKFDKAAKPRKGEKRDARHAQSGIEMERFRAEVGSAHGVRPENLVGAIANETGLDPQFIGRIKIRDDHSIIELPTGIPKFLLKDLRKVWVCNHKLRLSRLDAGATSAGDVDARATGKAQEKAPKRRKERAS